MQQMNTLPEITYAFLEAISRFEVKNGNIQARKSAINFSVV